MHTPETRTPLIAPALTRPGLLLAAMVAPQLLLLALNIRAWNLVHSEMSAEAWFRWPTLFGAQAVLLAAGLACWLLLRRRNQPLHALLCLPLFLLHAAFLWLVTAWMDDLLPRSVTTWMLEPPEFLYYQFALVMPALFAFGLRLAAFDLPVTRAADSGITLGALVGIPVTTFAALHVFSWLQHRSVVGTILFVLMVGATVLVLLAFLRTLLLVHLGLKRLPAADTVLAVAAGLAAPLGGLWLNHYIPFPYDFQAPSVYVLATVNGLMLLLPPGRTDTQRLATFLLRAATYTFTLYFFVVFLPFLPLALLAMIAFGAGFLILAPTLLFIIHTRRLWEEGRALAASQGVARIAILGTAAVLTLPLGFTGRALLHKLALNQGIEAAFEPDLTTGVASVDPPTVRHALERLQSLKRGLYLPFLSDAYDWLVFDGMVLPDHKIDRIAQTVLGEPLKPATRSRDFDLFSGNSGRRGRVQPWSRQAEPDRRVDVEAVTAHARTDGDLTRTTVDLTLRNRGADRSEYVGHLRVPDGALVTGYWLTIGTERVQGQLVERKAAQWIYHMIRDTTRRDPGLLVYQTDRDLELRIYPFTAGETRATSIEFTFPRTLHPALAVGDRTVALADAANAAPSSEILRVPAGASAEWLIVPPEAAAELPAVVRQPYLHLIVDRSARAAGAGEAIAAQMRAVHRQFPGFTGYRVSLANFEFRPLTEATATFDEALAQLEHADASVLPFRGGFCPERAIKGALLREVATNTAAGGPLAVPLFVVIPAPGSTPLAEGDLAPFARHVPDAAAYWVAVTNETLACHPFRETDAAWLLTQPLPPVCVFEAGGRVAACPADLGGAVALPRGTGAGPRVYNPTLGVLEAIEARELAPGSAYAIGAEAWECYRASLAHPGVGNDPRAELLRLGYASGVLTPSTSYIVLENDAQREMLRRKEQQALGARAAYEFDEFLESPAPAWWWFLPLLLVLLRRRARPARS